MNPQLLLRWSALLAVLMSGLAASRATAAPDDTTTTSPPLRVMTFNLRFASDKAPNSWPERRPVMKACWEQTAPDVAGTQEGVYAQLRDLASDLPDYEWIGLGRDGGSRGEFMAVFYRKARFEPLEYDHFWLSDTPNVIASTNWGNSNRRMVTWVRFKDRAADRQFYFINTHLDHALRSAREKGAALIRDRVIGLQTNLPVLLVGDFNAEPGKEPTYDQFVGDGFFRDTWTAVPVRRNAGLDTFHNYKGAKPGTFRIDWILTRGPWVCTETGVEVFEQNKQFPSDHHPVVATLRWE